MKTTINKLFESLESALPDQLAEDTKSAVQTAIRNGLDKMELVTREEFDIQEKILQRTQKRLDELEKQLIELESRTDK